MTEAFVLATVGSPFGLKGFVKVRSLSGETTHLAVLKSASLKQGDSVKVFSIEEITPFGSEASEAEFLLMKFHGIDSPEAAAALNGARLIADRSQAAPLMKGEFYIEDLKGLAVTAASGDAAHNSEDPKILGHITDILEGGGGNLAELRLLSGEIKLVPFRKEFFGDVSVENGWAVLLEQWILE